MNAIDYSFQRYLSAKRTVDDRSLNVRVWRRLEGALKMPAGLAPLRILEAGCGTGAMLYRMLDYGLFKNAEYHGVDHQEQNIREARLFLPRWAEKHGWQMLGTPQGGTLACGPDRIQVCFEDVDLFNWLGGPPPSRQYDLLVAHAFLDLVHFPSLASHLVELTKPGGMWYFTINFDGLTVLEPAISPEFDDQVIDLYHRSMDERKIGGKASGDSRTGRRLFSWLREAGLQVLEAGSSDWVVYAQDGGYLADEAYFLHYIIHTIHKALSGTPSLDPHRFEEWIRLRHRQVERGELVYIAHQLDMLAQKPLL